MSVWLLVAGDFTTCGGMDTANHALARYLASRQAHDDPEQPRTVARQSNRTPENEVHLVSHRVAPDLASHPSVRVHRVPRPFGVQMLGEPLLRQSARTWQKRLAGPRLHVVANGGNAGTDDVNWVHYVHAAFTPDAAGAWNRMRVASNHRRYVAQEEQALRRARLVICNSERTAADVVRAAGVPRDCVHVVHYGIDAARFGPVRPEERAVSRQALGIPADRRVALFVGALGDRRKGFDTLFEAWRTLCGRSDWDVDLLVAGAGAELAAWRARAAAQVPQGRMRFLGYQRDMPAVFAACDLLIHPARYEPYGLAVHEALCRGLPALVSASAGIAERYPADLRQLLIDDPDSGGELTNRLAAWRMDTQIAERVALFAARLRARSWDHMAKEIVALAEGPRV
jgi:glycosyltransferase involved in cell wall biosynthesis